MERAPADELLNEQNDKRRLYAGCDAEKEQELRKRIIG